MRLDWDTAERVYDAGVSNGVLYSDVAAAWNGLVAVNEAAAGSHSLEHYVDGQRVVIFQEIGDFEASIQAYTYPDAFDNHLDFENQAKRFGLSYRTQKNVGDEIHIVYGAMVKGLGLARTSTANAPTPALFEWKVQAEATDIPGMRPSAHLVIGVRESKPVIIETLENWLYGTETTDPRLPTPQELTDLFETHTTLRIQFNGDGSYTASGPDDVVVLGEDGTFQINAPTAYLLEDGAFIVNSY